MEKSLLNKKWVVTLNILVFTALAALMAFFTFFDLKISRALFNGESFLGKLFSCIGELPSYLTAPLFLACAFHKTNKKLLRVLCAVLLPFANYFWLAAIVGQLNLPSICFWMLVLTINVLVSATLPVMLKRVPADSLNKLFYVFLAGGLFAAANNLSVQAIKLVWGRVRFYNLNGNFTPWYQPNGPNGNYSFPSGHTASAFGIFTLMFLARAFNLSKPQRAALLALSISFVWCTALSRIVLGAHFATDVTFSVIISYALFLPAMKLIERKFVKPPIIGSK